jgi:hypothetical protein
MAEGYKHHGTTWGGVQLPCQMKVQQDAKRGLTKEQTHPNSEKFVLRSGVSCRFGTKYPGYYSNSIQDAANFYRSSNFYDDLSFLAAWLHVATKEEKYRKVTSGLGCSAVICIRTPCWTTWTLCLTAFPQFLSNLQDAIRLFDEFYQKENGPMVC